MIEESETLIIRVCEIAVVILNAGGSRSIDITVGTQEPTLKIRLVATPQYTVYQPMKSVWLKSKSSICMRTQPITARDFFFFFFFWSFSNRRISSGDGGRANCIQGGWDRSGQATGLHNKKEPRFAILATRKQSIMSKVAVKTTLDIEHTIRPIYTGGSLATDRTGRILVACVEEDIAITDLETGEQLAVIEGVSYTQFADLRCVRCANMSFGSLVGWRSRDKYRAYGVFFPRFLLQISFGILDGI